METFEICTTLEHTADLSSLSPPENTQHNQSGLSSAADILAAAEQQVHDEVSTFADTLKLLSKHAGLALLGFEPENEVVAVRTVQSTTQILKNVESMVNVMIVDAQPKVWELAAEIVTIKVGGGTVLAVSKDTLQQAPSGSILANMASDVWGHDLDSDGHIVQGVNSELFTAIINHLRLQALLPASEVPPIVVYEEQKTALDNLLSYYMLDEVSVETIKLPVVMARKTYCK